MGVPVRVWPRAPKLNKDRFFNIKKILIVRIIANFIKFLSIYCYLNTYGKIFTLRHIHDNNKILSF